MRSRPPALVAAVVVAGLLTLSTLPTLSGPGGNPAFAQTMGAFDEPVTGVQEAGAGSAATVIATDPADLLLTDEERELMALKLLPAWYPTIKLAQEEKGGSLDKAKAKAKSLFPYKNAVYSRRFGEPPHMLSWARRYRKDAAMVKLCAATQRGDILLNGHKSAEGQTNDMIAILTGGKYHHAVTVIDGPPAVFIEAVGLTGSKEDPTSNRVRVSAWHEHLADWACWRLLRPTAGLPAAEAQKRIDGAVAYLVGQLGKPYDYGFTNNDANRAFYCSELAWKAYHDGASWTTFLPVKDAGRDRMVVALNAVIDGMKPKDRNAVAQKVVDFTLDYTSQKPPDLKKLVTFIVDDLAPGCEVFADAFPTAASREKLRGVLEKVRTNRAFPGFLAAKAAFEEKKKAGKFETGWGIGAVRKLAAETKIVTSLVGDLNRLAKESGAGLFKLTKLIGSIIAPMYKYMGTYADFLTGMDKGGKVDLPDGAKTILSMTDWLAEKREKVKTWPVVGKALANLLPGNGDDKLATNFVSPTDLAGTSPRFHLDYP
ncbi:MAG: hypothetical protein GX442_21475 [Candidatus Riflebacteria bacterium]|nr:hypothetical protein [Candidatus Riflebacteria bacterium]